MEKNDMKNNVLIAMFILLGCSTPMLYAYLLTIAPTWMVDVYIWNTICYKYSLCLGIFTFGIAVINFLIMVSIVTSSKTVMEFLNEEK